MRVLSAFILLAQLGLFAAPFACSQDGPTARDLCEGHKQRLAAAPLFALSPPCDACPAETCEGMPSCVAAAARVVETGFAPLSRDATYVQLQVAGSPSGQEIGPGSPPPRA